MKNKIKMQEGLSADKKKGIKAGDPALIVYKDKAGNPTVGWGHMDPTMKVGDTITKALRQNKLTILSTTDLISHARSSIGRAGRSEVPFTVPVNG
jgi:GH24 family phage-related lysozyme (muramidase)